MTLLGRVKAARDGVIEIAPDLAASLADGDAAYAAFLDMVDAHVAAPAPATCPKSPLPARCFPIRLASSNRCGASTSRAAGIGAVIWATGYGVDFGWIDIPVLDARGEPIHRRGVTDVPGLYFLGLQWLSKMNSSFLSGVGDDAALLADHIAARG